MRTASDIVSQGMRFPGALATRKRRTVLGAALLASLLMSLALSTLVACGPNERTVAMQQLQAATPRERSTGVRTLARIGKADDDELWVAIERLTRDPSVQVRIVAAESLAAAPKADEREPDQRGALADDALSAQLADLDETVRIAAARVLGDRCNPRAIAYLHGAFSRSGPGVRPEVATSLRRCGVPLDKLLAHAEEVRRLHAMEKVDSNVPAWRATAARELGALGRPDDVKKISPLVDHRDGAIAAAAAEGLGLAGDRGSISALRKLAGDEVPLIASAAIDALASMGPEALAGAMPALVRQAQADGEQAVNAAGALLELSTATAEASAPKRDVLCEAALQAKVAAAAALLARGCPSAPFGEALAALMKSAKGPLDAATEKRAAALLEALGQTGPAATADKPQLKMLGTPTISSKAALALGALASMGDATVAIPAAERAGELQAVEAGPALVAVARREKAALDAERAAHKTESDDRAAAARELAEVAMHAPAGDRQKIAKLMAMVKARQEKKGTAPRPDASERLKELLASDARPTSAHPLLVATLRSALLVGAKGAAELAQSLREDPDASIAAAARGEPLALEPVAPPVPPNCFPAPAASRSPTHPDAGAPFVSADAGQSELDERRAELQSYVVRAPSHAAKPGCLAAQLMLGPQAPLPPGAVEAARASLWSDDGAERAAACELLALARDPQSENLRADFVHDPERRVRVACTAPGGTPPSGPR